MSLFRKKWILIEKLIKGDGSGKEFTLFIFRIRRVYFKHKERKNWINLFFLLEYLFRVFLFELECDGCER